MITHGRYTNIEVRVSEGRYMVTLDKIGNVVRVTKWTLHAPNKPWSAFYWRQVWHRAYKRKTSFSPLLCDVVGQAALVFLGG
jgi:hypothetical protein